MATLLATRTAVAVGGLALSLTAGGAQRAIAGNRQQFNTSPAEAWMRAFFASPVNQRQQMAQQVQSVPGAQSYVGVGCHSRWRMMADPPSGWQKSDQSGMKDISWTASHTCQGVSKQTRYESLETRSRIVGVATTVIGGLCASPAARCCFAHAVQQRFPSHFPIGASHCRFGGRDNPRAGGLGQRQPTHPTLAKILASVGLALTTRLEPYDDHDDVLWEPDQQRSEEQRAAIAVEQQRVFARRGS